MIWSGLLKIFILKVKKSKFILYLFEQWKIFILPKYLKKKPQIVKIFILPEKWLEYLKNILNSPSYDWAM